MRTIVFLIVIFSGFFLSSCSNEPKKDQKVGPGVLKGVEATLEYYNQVPNTAPRYGCNGERLQGQKITGWTTESSTTTQTVPCKFSDEDLKAAGYTYTGESTSHSRPIKVEEEGFSPIPYSGTKKYNPGWNMPWELLGWLFFIALALGILILLLWLLRELFHWLSRKKLGSHANNQNQDVSGKSIQTDESGPAPGKPGPQGTWVPAGYMLLPSGAVVVPYNGIYLGIRGENDYLGAEIYPQNQTSETTSEAQESQKNAEKIPPATKM